MTRHRGLLWKIMKGEPVSLADFRGYWVHLDFSADWCYWCHFQAEYMAEAERLLHDEGVDDFVSITLLSEDESGGPPSRAVLRKWVETYGIEYVLADPNVEITRLYPVRGYPTNVIVNPDGDIVEYWSGSYQTAEALVSALRSIAPDMFE